LQIARRAHVPGIGDDEASLRVELAERCAFFGGAGHERGAFSELGRAIACGLRRWTGQGVFSADCTMPPARPRDIAAAPAQWAPRPRGSPAPYRVAADRCASD